MKTNLFTKGLPTDEAFKLAMKDLDATEAGGVYAHNFMANMANTGWGSSALGGAAIGGAVGGGNSFLNGEGFFGSVASGAMTGAMFGAATKGGANLYSRNASSASALGLMKHENGLYSTTFQGNGVVSNPFKLGNFVGKPTAP